MDDEVCPCIYWARDTDQWGETHHPQCHQSNAWFERQIAAAYPPEPVGDEPAIPCGAD